MKTIFKIKLSESDRIRFKIEEALVIVNSSKLRVEFTNGTRIKIGNDSMASIEDNGLPLFRSIFDHLRDNECPTYYAKDYIVESADWSFPEITYNLVSKK
jgi:hypothetical protein